MPQIILNSEFKILTFQSASKLALELFIQAQNSKNGEKKSRFKFGTKNSRMESKCFQQIQKIVKNKRFEIVNESNWSFFLVDLRRIDRSAGRSASQTSQKGCCHRRLSFIRKGQSLFLNFQSSLLSVDTVIDFFMRIWRKRTCSRLQFCRWLWRRKTGMASNF